MWRDHSYAARYTQNIPHISFFLSLPAFTELCIYWTLVCVDCFEPGGQNQLSLKELRENLYYSNPRRIVMQMQWGM